MYIMCFCNLYIPYSTKLHRSCSNTVATLQQHCSNITEILQRCCCKFYAVWNMTLYCLINMEVYLSFKVGGVRLGEHNILTNPDCEQGYCAEPVQDFLPESVIVHENYNKPEFKNDIAIIRLNKSVIYNGEFVN